MATSFQLKDNTWGSDHTSTSVKPGNRKTGIFQFNPGVVNNATDASPDIPDGNG